MGEHFAAGDRKFPPVQHQYKRAQAFCVISAAPFVLHAMGRKKTDQRQKEKEYQCAGFQQR